MTCARYESLMKHVLAASNDAAFTFEETVLTWAELESRSRAYAAGLAEAGFAPGDRVAVFSGSTPELLIALLGHYRAGVIHVPINTRYRHREVEHILSDCGARAVAYDPASDAATILDEVAGGGGPAPPRIALGNGASTDRWTLSGMSVRRDSVVDEARRDDEEIALLIYTSGTTGRSKGVALSYRAVVSGIQALTDLWQWHQEDVLSLALPLFHVHGLGIGVHGTLLHGMHSLVHSRFDAASVCDDFTWRGASIFMGVPTMYTLLLEHLEADSSAADSLRAGRLYTSGSAALPVSDFRRFEELTGHRILERYGMSETMLTLSNPYDSERRPGPWDSGTGCVVDVLSSDGSRAADDEVGEIHVKGPTLLSFYWGLGDRPPLTPDGWFVTGDVARRDVDGYIHILGRKSVDIIKSGGYKISAREIEEVLLTVPGVREVAVVGVPDSKWGQRIEAAIVVGEHPATRESLDATCLSELADFKRPRAYHFIDEIPRNALGKVQKHRLLEALNVV